jgi:hypothetical protein
VAGNRRTGRWRAVGRQLQQKNSFFSEIFLENKIFNSFCSIFEQISNSPFYSNYSNKNLLRK